MDIIFTVNIRTSYSLPNTCTVLILDLNKSILLVPVNVMCVKLPDYAADLGLHCFSQSHLSVCLE